MLQNDNKYAESKSYNLGFTFLFVIHIIVVYSIKLYKPQNKNQKGLN